jgi:hypothetical protein
MRRTVLWMAPSSRPMTLPLVATLLLALTAATLLAFTAMLAQVPAASAQASADNKEVSATGKEVSADDLTTSELQAEEPRLGDSSFSVMCGFSHRNNDDPIVYPYSVYGEAAKDKAHSHDFLGNRTTRYDSTYTSLREATTPEDFDATSCNRSEDTSAYWVPTVKWNNQDLQPGIGIVYYRAGNKDHTTVQPFPAGLKVVTAPNKNVSWRCEDGAYSTKPPRKCSNGYLNVRVIFPDCSNGQVDSADHRSHMTDSQLQSDGTRACPSTHPTPVPRLSIALRYEIPTTKGRVTLSSGTASTMHSDFFDAWDPQALTDLVADCINKVGPSDTRPEHCSGL